jgi:hypothetical protein
VRVFRELYWKGLAGLFVAVSICIILLSLPPAASAAPTGTNFNHIVIIAMENQHYGSVIGSSSAPFINSLAQKGSTISNYHSYGQGISGCSAGCYQAFTAGLQTATDGWCPRASSPCRNDPNIASQLSTAGLTSAMFCEDGCPRGADHFPWIGYTNTWNSCVTGSFTCTGQTGPTGNALYGSTSSNSGCFSSVSSNAGNSALINYLNSASPANYIWFTPSDNHNMHDCSGAVSSGDQYLNSLLVGSGGSIANPNPGTVFSTSLFKQPGTFLYLWWDEYDPSPNVEYGSMIKVGYTSTGGYTEYNSLHTIEANWGLPYITSVVSGDSSMSDIFGSSAPGALSASLSYFPSAPQPNQTITFTASATGGAPPYSYSWSFGDGSLGTGATANHTYSKSGPYSVTLTVTDSNGTTSNRAQQVTVSTSSSPVSTLTFLYVGLIAGGAISVTAYLAKYHSRNRKLATILKDTRQARSQSG